MGSLRAEVEDLGPKSFSRDRLSKVPNLFAERAALFFTPTRALPPTFVGHGEIDVIIRVLMPSWLEYFQVPGYRSPRFWVDQLQRTTGRIRWTPLTGPATIRLVSYDVNARGPELLIKAMLDALKQSTTGRRDGRRLYYFGAIVDDGWSYIRRIEIREVIRTAPAVGECRIVVSRGEGSGPPEITHEVLHEEGA